MFEYREKRKDIAPAQGQVQEDQPKEEKKGDPIAWHHQRLQKSSGHLKPKRLFFQAET